MCVCVCVCVYNMYMYIRMYLCMCVCMHVCIYIYLYIHIFIYVYMFADVCGSAGKASWTPSWRCLSSMRTVCSRDAARANRHAFVYEHST